MTGPSMTEVIIVRAIQTCSACPSQWDAWDADGNYWYLRYRHSHGAAWRQPSPDWERWTDRPAAVSFDAQEGDADGVMDLETFCLRAGLNLHLTAEVRR